MRITDTKLVEEIHKLRDDGNSKLFVSKQLGLDYGTVRSWWNKDARVIQSAEIEDLKSSKYGFESHLGYQYSYLLGLYLGDGYINKQGKYTYKLRITQTKKYIKLIEEHKQALKDVIGCKVGIYQTKVGCVDVFGHSKEIPILFPQCGPGYKHSRKIELEQWQYNIVKTYPKQFIKGLIQTDGCRYIQTIKTKNGVRQYTKYNFTNTSQDIICLFCWACDEIGLYYTTHSRNSIRPKENTASGAIKTTVTFNKRKDVELLDTFVGPKC